MSPLFGPGGGGKVLDHPVLFFGMGNFLASGNLHNLNFQRISLRSLRRGVKKRNNSILNDIQIYFVHYGYKNLMENAYFITNEYTMKKTQG